MASAGGRDGDSILLLLRRGTEKEGMVIQRQVAGWSV